MIFRKALLIVLLLTASGGAVVGAESVGLRDFEILDLPAPGQRAPDRLQIRAFGRSFLLEVGSNPDLLAALPAVQRGRIASGDLFLTGSLKGVPGSWVRLNRIDGRFSGGFFDGNELYLIDRAGAFAGTRERGAPADRTIVFRFADLQASSLIDHGGVAVPDRVSRDQRASDYETFASHLREVADLQRGAMVSLPITVVSDVQFTERHAGSAASVVAGRINFIDGIFSSQVGVGITLMHHEILTDNDVLVATAAGDLLSGEFDGNTLVQPGFRQFMSTGAGSDIPFDGLAHLFTGRDLDGNTVGIAYLGVLCDASFGYGVDQDLNSETTAALVFAHEVGHNFNAPHDGQNACADETFEGIMNPIIEGAEEFSECSIREMSAELDRASCLVQAAGFDGLFTSGFESTAF